MTAEWAALEGNREVVDHVESVRHTAPRGGEAHSPHHLAARR